MGSVRRAFMGVIVAVCVLSGVELSLRLALPVARRATLPDAMVAAHVTSTSFRPDPDLFWFWAHYPDPTTPLDAHGFRARTDVPRAPAPGRLRVVAFGDSQTFGAGLTVEQAWPARVEAHLGEGWEVVNAGISGYRSLNVYRRLVRDVASLSPDVVVVDTPPYDSAHDDGRLEGEPLVPDATWPLRRVLWDSRLYWALRKGVEKLDPTPARYVADAGARARGEPGNHDLILEWGRRHGVRVLFTEYPRMGDAGSRYPCLTWPGELPIEPVPTCAALAASGLAPGELFLDNNHLTARGADVFASAVAEALRSEGPPPARVE